MNTSDEINEIAKSLSELQGNMNPARKDKINPYFKSYYSDLPSLWEAIRDLLPENGLAVVQDAVTMEIGVSIITRVIHTSGQWIEFGPLIVPLAKNDAQAVGSAISYGKRYALGAALGIVAEVDDDGNKATQAAKKQENKRPIGNSKPITQEQVADLFDIIDCEERGKAICAHFKVKHFRELTQDSYYAIKKRIEREKANATENA